VSGGKPGDESVWAWLDREHNRPFRGWAEVFRVLSVGRGRVLWDLAGLPEHVIAEPGALLDAARYFSVEWERLLIESARRGERGEIRPVFDAEMEKVLQRTRSSLEAAYGKAGLGLLFQWARRHFLDRDERHRLDSWSGVFIRLFHTNYRKQMDMDWDPLSADRMMHLKETVQSHAVDAASDLFEGLEMHDARLDALEEAAQTIPLSDIERRIVHIPAMDGDPAEEYSVTTALRTCVTREEAARIWAELDTWLTDSERGSLEQWRQQALQTLRGRTEGHYPPWWIG
jgi:hypothetical protein